MECQMLNIIGYFFSLSYMPMHGLLQKEKYAKKNDQNALNIIAIVYFRRCRSYKMYLEGDNPHQIGYDCM